MFTVKSIREFFISRTISEGGGIYTFLKYLFSSCKTEQNSSFQTIYKVISINLFCSGFNYTLQAILTGHHHCRVCQEIISRQDDHTSHELYMKLCFLVTVAKRCCQPPEISKDLQLFFNKSNQQEVDGEVLRMTSQRCEMLRDAERVLPQLVTSAGSTSSRPWRVEVRSGYLFPHNRWAARFTRCSLQE